MSTQAEVPKIKNPELAKSIEVMADWIKDVKSKVAGFDERVRHLENADARENLFGNAMRGAQLANAETGEIVQALKHGDSLRSWIKAHRPELVPSGGGDRVSVGQLLEAAIFPNRATPEVWNQLDRTSDSTGGLSVNEWLSASVIDRLRQRLVLSQAGAAIVPLDATADKHHFLAIASDPAPAWRQELGAVAESEPTFRRVTFEPQSLAVIVRASRELLQDSGNVAVAIETAIAGAFAAELDRVGLWGSGEDAEPLGIAETPGVHQVNDIELESYAPILRARRKILESNASPSAVIMSPELEEGFELLAADDGQPLRRPRSIETLPFLATSSAGSSAIAGDFQHLWIGLRQGLRIELLREKFAGTFEHALLCHMRLDVAAIHPAAFAIISAPEEQGQE